MYANHINSFVRIFNLEKVRSLMSTFNESWINKHFSLSISFAPYALRFYQKYQKDRKFGGKTGYNYVNVKSSIKK